MNILIRRSIWILVLAFLVCISILTETISVYTSTFNPAGGNVDLVIPGVQNYPDVFYKVADTNDSIDVENGIDPSNMTGDADAFIPVSNEYNIRDGYTYSVSVKTSVAGDFFGMGFYFYSYSNPHNATVDGISLQLTPDSLIAKEQFVFIKKSYNALSADDDLSDGNNSILFVKEDFYKYDNVIKYPSSFAGVINKLESFDRYDGKTLDFRVAVKQDEKDNNKVNVQVTVNDYCFGYFTQSMDVLNVRDSKSVLCVGAKTFHTGDKHFSFTNIVVSEHETFVPWRFQSEI